MNLRINGIRVLSIRPNLKIKMPSIGDGAYVVLFERLGSTTTPDAGQTNGGTYGADVMVNMIHVHIPPPRAGKPPIDVIVSHAHSHADFPQTRVCTASAPASVSGYAYVASTTFDHPALPLVVLGYADIPNTGGAASQGLAELFLPKVLTAGAATSSSYGVITADAAKSTSKASVANVNLLDGKITATVIQSQSNSREAADSPGSTATGTGLIDIAVAGKHIANNPPANTKYELPGLGYVIFNEMIADGAAPGHTGLTVRAIHLHANRLAGVVPGSDVIVSESHSDATR